MIPAKNTCAKDVKAVAAKSRRRNAVAWDAELPEKIARESATRDMFRKKAENRGGRELRRHDGSSLKSPTTS